MYFWVCVSAMNASSSIKSIWRKENGFVLIA